MKTTRYVKFTHLYGDTFVAFRGKRLAHKRREAIFPDGFTPTEGVSYLADIQETATGDFVHNEEHFSVSRARLCEAADENDLIMFARARENKTKPLNPLADALNALA